MSIIKDNTRKKILNNACSTFKNVGLVKTSMDMIANKCGVTRRTLYRYFKSKDELAFEVIIILLEEFNSYQLDVFITLKQNGIDNLKNFLYALVNYMNNRRKVIVFMGEFDYFYSDNNDFTPNENIWDRYMEVSRVSEEILFKIFEQGRIDKSINLKGRDQSLIIATISNVLWSFGQRIALRGKLIEEELKTNATGLIYCQIDLNIDALK